MPHHAQFGPDGTLRFKDGAPVFATATTPCCCGGGVTCDCPETDCPGGCLRDCFHVEATIAALPCSPLPGFPGVWHKSINSQPGAAPGDDWTISADFTRSGCAWASTHGLNRSFWSNSACTVPEPGGNSATAPYLPVWRVTGGWRFKMEDGGIGFTVPAFTFFDGTVSAANCVDGFTIADATGRGGSYAATACEEEGDPP